MSLLSVCFVPPLPIKPGLIERNLSLIGLSDSRQFLQDIVCQAASQSDKENRVRDAILLYNLAEEYNTVIEVLNRDIGSTLFDILSLSSSSSFDQALSGELAGGRKTLQGSSEQSQRDERHLLADAQDTAQLAKAIVASYEKQGHILKSIQPAKRETIQVLLALKDAVNLFHAGELDKSLNVSSHGTLRRLSRSFALLTAFHSIPAMSSILNAHLCPPLLADDRIAGPDPAQQDGRGEHHASSREAQRSLYIHFKEHIQHPLAGDGGAVQAARSADPRPRK